MGILDWPRDYRPPSDHWPRNESTATLTLAELEENLRRLFPCPHCGGSGVKEPR